MGVPYAWREPCTDIVQSGLDVPMQFMTCKQIARYFFESDELRNIYLWVT